MSPIVSLLLFLALAVPMSAALLAAVAPAHTLALEAKYVIGRLVALSALMIATPLLMSIALAVVITSRGPVLFRQMRVGEGGETFAMLKFRSMRVDDAAAAFVPVAGAAPGGVEGVDRRTAVGRFIRRTSLDELPQLWNVVRGDMCLVGPRPERPEHVDRFSGEIPGYAARHRVRVGLTGLAQVAGARGAGSCMATRAQLDNEYIDSWSLGLDMRILGRTVGAVLRGAE
ncbi:MAG TPA: sugar transferase [Baekduia sp.]|uniref:sugar transferase n=1 Tax=Baekduia sp. TaxID=2600305 RepID=UPI002D78038B|nr:sugar transferase [Baekduia sp.]HET6508668.1 sugar transferase [Baekduia sp.]